MDTRVVKHSSGGCMHRQEGSESLVGDMHGHEASKALQWGTYA
jgi:hypothetical protein